jgi:hypothetical protein
VSEAAIRAVQTAAGNVEAEASRAAGGRMNVETERGAMNCMGRDFSLIARTPGARRIPLRSG